MPYFAKRSLKNLSTCHWDLQKICQEAIKEIDFTVICGHRDKAKQDQFFKNKTSRLKWPKSKHNKTPSKAVDILPCPFINWEDTERFEMVAQVMTAAANRLGIKIVSGALDWQWDLGHFELK